MYKYNFIADDIKNKITNHFYKVNEKLPDESTLSLEYNCSRMTIKKAMDILVSEGFIIKYSGVGTLIRAHQTSSNKGDEKKYYSNSTSKFGFNSSFKDIEHSTEVVTFNVIECPEGISDKLQISNNSFVYFVERIRCIEKKPIIFETLYLPVDKIVGLTRTVLENSLYEYIEKKLNIKIYNADKFIKAKLADEKDMLFLKMEKYKPILELEHIVYSNKNIPIEFAKLHYNAEYYELHFITKNG